MINCRIELLLQNLCLEKYIILFTKIQT